MEEQFTQDKKIKKLYKAPESVEEAVEALKTLPARTFAKLKGKGLTIIESWWDKDDSRLSPAKSLYNTMIADICNQFGKEIDDVLKVLS